MFTYDPEQIKSSPLFRARFQLGDTDKNNPLVQDTEITGMIEVYGYAEGVAQVADGLASRFAQEPDEYEDEGKVRVRWSFKVKTWQDLALRLRGGAAKAGPGVPSGVPMIGELEKPDMSGFRA